MRNDLAPKRWIDELYLEAKNVAGAGIDAVRAPLLQHLAVIPFCSGASWPQSNYLG
jgi:hypothetical protein